MSISFRSPQLSPGKERHNSDVHTEAIEVITFGSPNGSLLVLAAEVGVAH